MRAVRNRLRRLLVCVAFGSLSIGYLWIHRLTPSAPAVPPATDEVIGISLPLTVAWFSFCGACWLSQEERGLLGILSACSRFAGQAALFAGIPVWGYWYLHLVFDIL